LNRPNHGNRREDQPCCDFHHLHEVKATQKRPLISRLFWVGCWFVGVLGGAALPVSAQLCGQDYTSDVQRVLAQAENLPGARPRLVLLGSSSFRKWPETDTVFPRHDVVNAGIGGSCFSDLLALHESLLVPLRPDVLLIYEGDNDLADGVPVDEVVANAELLFGAIQERLPDTEVVVVAPKASLARANLWDTYLELNARLRLAVEARGMHWVDFWAVQHTPEGTLRDELFEADRLHLNDNGYAVWVAELRRQLPWLDPQNHVATEPARHAP